MSLRKSPTRTPAFLEANRRNAQMSTGPWTRRGKAQSCLNRLENGWRSRVYRRLWFGLLDAPPCAVKQTAHALLTREQATHPVFAELVDLLLWAESMAAMHERWFHGLVAAKQKAQAACENEPQKPTEAHSGSALTSACCSNLAVASPFRAARAGLKPVATPHRAASTSNRGRGQKKRMLEIDVGSRKVIENTRNGDILSCDSADILGSLVPILTGNGHFGAIKITFSMRFGRQCRVLAMPRCEPPNLPAPRRTNHRRPALDVHLDS